MSLDPIVLQSLQVIAAIASSAAAYLSFSVARENKRLSAENLELAKKNRIYTRNSTNRAAAAKHEEMIAAHPELLELHGIDSKSLVQLGVTSTEASYLLSSFSAGNLYYLDGEVTELTEYRKQLLRSPKVRAFWSHVLNSGIIGAGPFAALINEHIKQVYGNSTDARIQQ